MVVVRRPKGRWRHWWELRVHNPSSFPGQSNVMLRITTRPNYSCLLLLLFQVSNIDDVLNYHTDFLNNCLKDCMLTNPELLKIVHKLMMVCVTFCNFIQVFLPSSKLLCSTTSLIDHLHRLTTPRYRSLYLGPKQSTIQYTNEF